MKQKTSIIIVTYKALDYVKSCLNSIFEKTRDPFELIIVDNNSGEDMIEYLSGIKDIKLIKNETNRLLTPAQNQALEQVSDDSEYVLFLNPDTVILKEGWLEEFKKPFIQDKTVGIVGPFRNYSYIGPLCGNIDMCCLMTRHSMLRKSGGLDNEYPWNGAGFVYTAWAWSQGFVSLHLKKPQMVRHYHKKSRSFNFIPNREIYPKRVMQEHGITPKFSLKGLYNQIINHPGTVWTGIKKALT